MAETMHERPDRHGRWRALAMTCSGRGYQGYGFADCGTHRSGMRDRLFAVCILTTRRRTVLYVGVTNDLRRRLLEHRAGSGSRFVRRYSVNRLVYVEWFREPRPAIAREKQLKAGARGDKVALIDGMNPGWEDLGASILGL